MDFEYRGSTLKFNRVLSELDSLVIGFAEILEKAKIKYVIISGYVTILFGRSRTTEDIDVFVPESDLDDFKKMFNLLVDGGYHLVDSDSLEDAFDRLQNSLSIRVAKENTIIPNFEIKFPNNRIALKALNDPLQVVVNGKRLYVSRFEIQIPFKISLGGKKDIEDALHLYELFKEKLDKGLMTGFAKELKVEKEMKKYGIV